MMRTAWLRRERTAASGRESKGVDVRRGDSDHVAGADEQKVMTRGGTENGNNRR